MYEIINQIQTLNYTKITIYNYMNDLLTSPPKSESGS